jgi:hypothetical protein
VIKTIYLHIVKKKQTNYIPSKHITQEFSCHDSDSHAKYLKLDSTDLALIDVTNSEFVAGFFENGNCVVSVSLCLYCEVQYHNIYN